MPNSWRWKFLLAIAALVIAGLFAAAAWWRSWFPYSDAIASLLPEGTVAYAHLNLTSINRAASHRFFDRNVGRVKELLGPELALVLDAAFRSREVREVAFIVDEVDDRLRYTFVIGQRASDRPDIVAPQRVVSGDQSVAVAVLRIPKRRRALNESPFTAKFQPLRHQPLRVVLRPRAIVGRSGGEFRALADAIPEFMAAAGSFGRNGLAINSDGAVLQWPHYTKIKLSQPLAAGDIAIVNVPLRVFAPLIAGALPESVRSVSAALPERADIQVASDRSTVVARLPTEPTLFAVQESVWRALAATIWPTRRPRLLDGLISDVAVVDPEAYRIIATGDAQWEVGGADKTVRASVEQCADSIVVASDSFADCGGAVAVRVPSRCRVKTDDIAFLFAVGDDLMVSVAWGIDLKSWTACLFSR